MKIDEIALKIQVELFNDTKKPVPYKILSAYVNNHLVLIGDSTLWAGQSMKIKLSDVSFNIIYLHHF